MATGTQLGPGPGIVSAESKNLLDLRRNKEYQSPVCGGLAQAPFIAGRWFFQYVATALPFQTKKGL